MEVVVQQLKRKMFLAGTGDWTPSRGDAKKFGTALEAIVFCVRLKVREAHLVGKNAEGQEVRFYPFGGDPVARAERRRIRRGIAESRRLKHQRQNVRARIDLLLAEAKEKRKQFPFKRTNVAEQEDPRTDTDQQE